MASKARKKVPSLQTQMAEHIDDYGWCRSNQHIWQNPTGSGLTVNKGVVSATFVCANCGGSRFDDISLKTGEVLNRSYRHPEGYLMKVPDGLKKPSKSDWRREHFRNILKGVR